MTVVLHFLLDNGIGQNLTAGVLIGTPTCIWGYLKLRPKIQAHLRRVREIHEHLTGGHGEDK